MDISILSSLLAETNLYEGGVEVGEMEDMAYQTETDEFNEEDEELSFPTHDNISINGGGVGQQGVNERPGQKGYIFNSCTAIAGAIIGLLLVFLRLEEEYWFSLGFLQEVDLFTRHFDLKAKVRKAVLVNRFSLSERSFLIMRCV